MSSYAKQPAKPGVDLGCLSKACVLPLHMATVIGSHVYPLLLSSNIMRNMDLKCGSKEAINRGWRDNSAVQSVGCSSRGPGINCHHHMMDYNSSLRMPSLDFHWHFMHMTHTHTCRQILTRMRVCVHTHAHTQTLKLNKPKRGCE